MNSQSVLGPTLSAVMGVLAALAMTHHPPAASTTEPARADSEVRISSFEAERQSLPRRLDQDAKRIEATEAPANAVQASRAPKETLALAVISAGHRSTARAAARKLQRILGLDPAQTRRVDDLIIECVQESLGRLFAPTMTLEDFECLGAVPEVLQGRISPLLTETQRGKLRETFEILDDLVFDPDAGSYSIQIDLSDLPSETQILAKRQLRWFDASSSVVATRRGIDLATPEQSAQLMNLLKARLLERMTPLVPADKLATLRDMLR